MSFQAPPLQDALFEDKKITSAPWTLWLKKVAAQILAWTGTSTTATGGAATLPANPQGFFVINIKGVDYKIPYYNS